MSVQNLKLTAGAPGGSIATDWQINFQDPATPIASRIIEIHHHVFFFLLIVITVVSYMIYITLIHYVHILKKESDLNTFIDTFSNSKINDWKLNYNFNKNLKTLRNLFYLKFTHNTVIEIIWTSIPSLILVLIAIPSFGLLYSMDDFIDPDLTFEVVGHQWYWSYACSNVNDGYEFISFDQYMSHDDFTEYADDYLVNNLIYWDVPRLLNCDNKLYLPKNAYIRFNITSADVLHSWAIPSFGIKVDAVPGRINSVMAYTQRSGLFYGQCSELCGTGHGFMPISIRVL